MKQLNNWAEIVCLNSTRQNRKKFFFGVLGAWGSAFDISRQTIEEISAHYWLIMSTMKTEKLFVYICPFLIRFGCVCRRVRGSLQFDTHFNSNIFSTKYVNCKARWVGRARGELDRRKEFRYCLLCFSLLSLTCQYQHIAGWSNAWKKIWIIFIQTYVRGEVWYWLATWWNMPRGWGIVCESPSLILV